MMKQLLPSFAAAVFAAIMAVAPAARAQIKMNIVGPGSQLSAIAVSGLKNLSGDDNHQVSAAFLATLNRDLELSGYFRLISAHAYIEDAQQSGYELGQFNFADWRSINADFLVKGAVTLSGQDLKLTALLYDVAQQRRMMGRNFTGSPADVPRMARRFADAILQAATGQQGPFDTRLAFVSTGGRRFKEIYTQSIDGQDVEQRTFNRTINLFPSFDKGRRHLLYLSYKTGEPALYLADLKSKGSTRITSTHGMVIGGTISPGGQRIVAAVEHGGATNLYLLDHNGSELSELTHTSGINVSPAFSADGAMLAFTSDRSGTPQIYVMPAAGGAARRITYKGNYNTTPAFSPSADRIAYQSRSGGRFDIFVIPAKGGEPTQVSDGVGSNESPAWSPDGRYLAFSSTRGGHARIYLLMVRSGKIISALTEGKGNDTSPAWSWWLGE
ncbi:MAG TPA: Tol-Pal system beta propeller repeat protein TolB [Candidatus Binataceae bacterium]|nr:Tol-Pal system beta propeller repeat protein TolB [Candidatus Binataceae bacterium]